MQGRIMIVAGVGGHTGYACALAQALHEKISFSFLVSERDVLSERKLCKFGEINFLIEPQSPKTSRTTKKCQGIERC